jgi:hypothetical protein
VTQLHKIVVNDWITYKNKTTLRLAPNTVTAIRGKNLDRRDKTSSNGAGKSVIASILPQMLFNEAPLPMKAKKSPKEGFNKDTYQTVCLTDNVDNKYEIKKYFKGTTRLQIIKNGKDLNFKDSSLMDKSDARAFLARLLPLNEEQFYSLYYFDVKRSSVLQYGTDAQRHKFIENLFQLDIYDHIGQDVKKDWDKSKLIIQELEILDRELSSKSDNLAGDPIELKKRHLELVEKTDRLRIKVGELIKERDKCQTFIVLSKDIKNISIDKIKLKLYSYKKELGTVKQTYLEAIAHNEKIKSNEQITHKRDTIVEQLTLLDDIKVDKSIQEKISEDRALLNSIEETLDNNKDVNRKLSKVLNGITELSNSIKDYDKKIAEKSESFSLAKIEKNKIREQMFLNDLKTNLKDTIEHLKSHGEQNCPVCFTLLDEATLKDLVDQKKKNVEKSGARLDTLSAMLSYKKDLEALKSLKDEENLLKKELKSVDLDSEKLEKRIEKNEALLQKMRRKVLLKAKLSELPEVTNDSPIDVGPIKENIASLEEKVSYYTDQKNKIEQLEKLELPFKSLKDAEDKNHDVGSSLIQYQPMLEKLQNKLNVVSVDSVRAEAISKDIDVLSEKINKLKLGAPDFKIQTVLRKAFGPRGIRKQRVAEIGSALETTLNKYAEQVFDFKISFELIITDTKFQILAKRNNKVSDVRRLSGAESRYFTLLLMITLLKYTPQSLRLDTVFLDEAEASLDKAFRDRFITNFIPLLQEVVSKVVVITPMSEKELFIPKSIQYTATKEGGVTTLTKSVR